MSARRMIKNKSVQDCLEVENGRLSIKRFSGMGPLDIRGMTDPIPEDIKLGHIPSLIVSGESEALEKSRDQFPTSVESFTVVGEVKRGLDGFRIQCCDCTIDPGPQIKNLTLDIPTQRPGLRVNKFDLALSHITSDSDIKNIKINGHKCISVMLDGSTYGPEIAMKAKKEVMKLRKSQPNTPVYELFTDVIRDLFPLKWVEKNWVGVETIIFKSNQSANIWPKGSVYEILRYLKTGDLVISKVDSDWIAFQKMIKTPEDEYVYFR